MWQRIVHSDEVSLFSSIKNGGEWMASLAAAWLTPEAVATALVVHFEVHVLHQGRWVIDCSGQDEAAVRAVAHEYSQRPDVLGVRLIREIYNPGTNQAAARILLENLKPKRESRRVFLASRPTEVAPPPIIAGPAISSFKPAAAPAKPASAGFPVAALASIAIGFLLVVTLISLLAWS